MPVIAALTVLLYVVAVTLVTAMVRKLPQHGHTRLYSLRYADGHGILRDILSTASDLGYEAALAHAKRQGDHNPVVEATMRFTRRQQSADEELFRRLSEIDGVHEVRSVQQDHD